jgi:hypothetical protein
MVTVTRAREEAAEERAKSGYRLARRTFARLTAAIVRALVATFAGGLGAPGSFMAGLAGLYSATGLEWLRDHTRLLLRARGIKPVAPRTGCSSAVTSPTARCARKQS